MSSSRESAKLKWIVAFEFQHTEDGPASSMEIIKKDLLAAECICWTEWAAATQNIMVVSLLQFVKRKRSCQVISELRRVCGLSVKGLWIENTSGDNQLDRAVVINSKQTFDVLHLSDDHKLKKHVLFVNALQSGAAGGGKRNNTACVLEAVQLSSSLTSSSSEHHHPSSASPIVSSSSSTQQHKRKAHDTTPTSSVTAGDMRFSSQVEDRAHQIQHLQTVINSLEAQVATLKSVVRGLRSDGEGSVLSEAERRSNAVVVSPGAGSSNNAAEGRRGSISHLLLPEVCPDAAPYLKFTFDGKPPQRPPVTLSFLRTASVSELYFSGIWVPEFDADNEFDCHGTSTPQRDRRFLSSFTLRERQVVGSAKFKRGDDENRYIPGYDIDDVNYEDVLGIKAAVDERQVVVVWMFLSLMYA